MTVDIGGIIDLGEFPINIAKEQIGTSIIFSNLISSVTLNARLAFGSGGMTVIGVVQTSLDQGTTWIDIARFDFATTGLEKVMNLTNVAITSPYTVIALASEGSNNGILGD